jgi:hypothetical protein
MVAYIEQTNGAQTWSQDSRFDHNLSSETTQGKASAVADKRIAKPLNQRLLTQGLVAK